MWDYKYDLDECWEVILGKRDKVGHYERNELFLKLTFSVSLKNLINVIPDNILRDLINSTNFDSQWNFEICSLYNKLKDILQKSPDYDLTKFDKENPEYPCNIKDNK